MLQTPMASREPVIEEHDVVIVGARCAGAPLATLLARRGWRVLVLERATFPRDTLSTHIFQAPALSFLDGLGVVDDLRRAGVCFVGRGETRVEDLAFSAAVPRRPGDLGGFASVRRTVLDPLLADAAEEAGADVRFGATVTGLVREDGRVAGVRARLNGEERTFKARLVVGADGRNSTVAKLAAARRYNVTPSERFVYWSYFRDAHPGPDPAAVFHRWDGQMVLACPADNGLYQVIVSPEADELPRFRADLEGAFMEYANRCEPVRRALAGATRAERILGILRWEGFFREPSGPGWLLVGDAGHFKDPTAGQGIADAFRQVEEVVPLISSGLARTPQQLDTELASWGERRDVDAFEHYWLTADLGKAGRAPAVLPEAMRRLQAKGRLDSFLDLFHHRSLPSDVLTPPVMIGATASLLRRRGTAKLAILREVGSLMGEDQRRRRLLKDPEYVEERGHRDAGATEVAERPLATGGVR